MHKIRASAFIEGKSNKIFVIQNFKNCFLTIYIANLIGAQKIYTSLTMNLERNLLFDLQEVTRFLGTLEEIFDNNSNNSGD